MTYSDDERLHMDYGGKAFSDVDESIGFITSAVWPTTWSSFAQSPAQEG
ncbi:hypothetical protein [Consotaella aegiceratis]